MTALSTCPQCATALRPDAAWCPLCFAQLSAGFDPLTAPIEEVLNRGGGVTTRTQPVQPAVEAVVEDLSPPVLPAVVEPAMAFQPPVPLSADAMSDEEVVLSDVDVMLAMLAAEHRQADPAAEIVDRLGDRNARIVIMIGGTVAVTLVGFVILAVLGALG